MTLHVAIAQLLQQKNRPMTAYEIAEELDRNRWYQKSDGSPITRNQISARRSKYKHSFNLNDTLITLVHHS